MCSDVGKKLTFESQGLLRAGDAPSGNGGSGWAVVRGRRPAMLAGVPATCPLAMSTALSSQHVWLVRLCTLGAFVLTLGWAPRAFAAAPMCGLRAQSIAAPPVGTPANTDSLSAPKPCEEGAPLRAAKEPQREAPRALSFPDQPLRALPIAPRFGPCAVTARLPAAAAESARLPAGFARSIDRPPRA